MRKLTTHPHAKRRPSAGCAPKRARRRSPRGRAKQQKGIYKQRAQQMLRSLRIIVSQFPQ